MTVTEMENHIFGMVMTLCKLHEEEGMSIDDSKTTVGNLLVDISNSLNSLKESTDN